MVNFKKAILIVTILLFAYNAFFTYIIVQLTTGIGRLVFLILVSLDYIIIFYFVLSIASELRRTAFLNRRGSQLRKARK